MNHEESDEKEDDVDLRPLGDEKEPLIIIDRLAMRGCYTRPIHLHLAQSKKTEIEIPRELKHPRLSKSIRAK